jgi:hypothetical protein
MGNVISWADATKALEVIAEEQEAISGMSVSEAAAALNYTKTASGMYLKLVTSTTSESVVGTTATEVATGATSTATTTAVNLTLLEGADGTATVAGIGSIAAPIASCIAASVGGYIIGSQIYKSNSDFLDKLMFPLYDFITGQHVTDYVYGDNNASTVPFLFDANGYTFLPSALLSGVKSNLDSIYNAGTPAADASYIQEAVSYVTLSPTHKYYCLVFYSNEDYYQVLYATTPIVIEQYDLSGNQPNMLAVRCQPPGTCLSYHSYGSYHLDQYSSSKQLVIDTLPDIPYNSHIFSARIVSSGTELKNGDDIIYTPPIEIPDGVTKYTPTVPDVEPVKTPDGQTWNTVFLPSTSPDEMPDGEPVPTTAPDPARITPYIPPVQPQPNGVPVPDSEPATTTNPNPIIIPNPEPDTSPDPYPSPDPEKDPSQLPDTPSTPTEPENIPDPSDDGSVVVPVTPPVPAPSAAKGLLHVYNPTPAQVDQFGEWLWTTFSGDLIDTLAKLFNNPMDAVIGLHELYCTPATSGTETTIKAGFFDSGVASRLVSSRYKEIKCGAISVPEFWGNYLDYSPYTKSYCYLPFIGIVELNTDDIVGSGVEITYRVDTYNGSCIALITTAKPNSDECISYQFEGNCSVSVPITSGMMSAVQNALIGVATTALSAGVTAAVTVATGGTALPAAVMVGTAAAGGAQHGLTSKNQVQCSGSFGSSFGAMGVKKPFLIIKRPRQKVVYGYNTNYGYPSHKMVLISTCSGYLRAKEVEVISPTATEAEKKMIENLLKSGVYVN